MATEHYKELTEHFCFIIIYIISPHIMYFATDVKIINSLSVQM